MKRSTFRYILETNEHERINRIMQEFSDGFNALAKFGKIITIFGGTHIKKDDKYYDLARQTAYKLAQEGYSIMTGAGPGIMEAANKGAKEAGDGKSIGLNIELPVQQKPNSYIDTLIPFRYFFVRKVMFAKYSKAFITFPGGYGTFDELCESLTLIQTKKVRPFPVVIFGSEYWKNFIGWLEKTVAGRGLISQEDLNIFTVVDKVDDVLKAIKDFYPVRNCKK
jgi:uncharacterized protein (TIGR00730 family)